MKYFFVVEIIQYNGKHTQRTPNGEFAIILNSLHGFVFLKQSYFVFDVIMVDQNAKKIIAFSSS